MIYIINNVVVYDSVSGTISLIAAQDEPEHRLTAINNRLLSLLIENKGEILSKELCLQKVWEAHGLDGSVNTLTQYISILRKIFSAYFDDEEFIITVPRKGYKVSTDFKISQAPLRDTHVLEALEFQPQELSPTKSIIKRHLFIGGMFLLLLLMTVFLYMSKSITPKLKNDLLFTYGQCPVYTLDTVSHDKAIEYRTKVARLLLNEHKISCLPSSSFYISVNKGAEDGVSGIVMLARCLDNESASNSCITYHYSRW